MPLVNGPPRAAHAANLDQENPGAVTLIEDVRCDLESGDYVTFKDVEGMTELNDAPPMKVNVKGPFALEIVDTTVFSAYKKGGVMQEVKMPSTLNFVSTLSPFLMLRSQS